MLMDQRRIAGLGNLLVDEILWRAGIDPYRPPNRIDADERKALHRTIRRTLACAATVADGCLACLCLST